MAPRELLLVKAKQEIARPTEKSWFSRFRGSYCPQELNSPARGQIFRYLLTQTIRWLFCPLGLWWLYSHGCKRAAASPNPTWSQHQRQWRWPAPESLTAGTRVSCQNDSDLVMGAFQSQSLYPGSMDVLFGFCHSYLIPRGSIYREPACSLLGAGDVSNCTSAPPLAPWHSMFSPHFISLHSARYLLTHSVF